LKYGEAGVTVVAWVVTWVVISAQLASQSLRPGVGDVVMFGANLVAESVTLYAY
jgi:hypothetical protein